MSSTPSTVGGYDIELTGAPTLAGSDGGNLRVLHPPQPFPSGGFLSFNGTDQYGTATGLLDSPPAAGCVALWVRFDTPVAANETIFSKASAHAAGAITEGMWLGFEGGGTALTFRIYSGGSSFTAVLELGGLWGADSAGADVWHHVVCSWGTKVRLWVDGENVGEAAHTGAWANGSASPFSIAAKYLAAASTFCDMSVDELEVRSVEPSQEDVLTWTNRGGLPQTYERDRWVPAANPLLAPTGLTGEDTAVFEPQLTRVSAGVYRGVYTGGIATARLFGMSSTNGKTLTKSGGAVMGQGAGGHAGNACRPFILNDGGDLYLYFSDEIPTTGGSIHYATTADNGVTWTEQGVVVAPDAVRTGFANASVVNVDGTYHWLIEHVRAGGGQAYFTTYYTSTDPVGPLTLVDDVLPDLTLRQGVGSVSTRLLYFGGKFHLFPHLGRYSNLPTAIYHAVSDDCRRWEVRGGGDPMIGLDFAVLPRQDQAADACVYEIPESGEVGILHDVDVNQGGGYVARICGATFEGTLADLA